MKGEGMGRKKGRGVKGRGVKKGERYKKIQRKRRREE